MLCSLYIDLDKGNTDILTVTVVPKVEYSGGTDSSDIVLPSSSVGWSLVHEVWYAVYFPTLAQFSFWVRPDG